MIYSKVEWFVNEMIDALTVFFVLWKVFYVIKGNVLVTIHQSSAVLNTGSTFFVPQGNFICQAYSFLRRFGSETLFHHAIC